VATVDGESDGGVSSRNRVLQVLREAPEGRGVHEVAADVGLHPNTVRFHLERLEQQGLVHRQIGHHDLPGRPPLRFTATGPSRESTDDRDFQDLAELLAGILSQQVPGSPALSEQAGRAWAHRLVEERGDPVPSARKAIELLVGMLSSVGFAPQVTADGEQITVLQPQCPFLEVARLHRDVVCSIQLGLIRGVLERLGAPVEVIRLTPFATPQGCLVQFNAR